MTSPSPISPLQHAPTYAFFLWSGAIAQGDSCNGPIPQFKIFGPKGGTPGEIWVRGFGEA